MTHAATLQGPDAVLLAHIIALLEQKRCTHHQHEFTVDRFSVRGRLETPQWMVHFCRNCGLTLNREPRPKPRRFTS